MWPNCYLRFARIAYNHYKPSPYSTMRTIRHAHALLSFQLNLLLNGRLKLHLRPHCLHTLIRWGRLDVLFLTAIVLETLPCEPIPFLRLACRLILELALGLRLVTNSNLCSTWVLHLTQWIRICFSTLDTCFSHNGYLDIRLSSGYYDHPATT